MKKVITFIDEFVENHYELNEGFNKLLKFIEKQFPDFEVEKLKTLNITDCQNEFKFWLENVLKIEPISEQIKSLWFGLFLCKEKSFFKKIIYTNLYLSGSVVTPIDDEDDWPCDTTYFPESRYSSFKFLKSISKIIDMYDQDNKNYLEILFYVSFSSLLIKSSLEYVSDLLFKNNKEFFIGTGFDEGDFYVLGKFNGNGLK